MSANSKQIKAMLERAGKTNLLQNKKVDLNKERLQLEATVKSLGKEAEGSLQQEQPESSKGKFVFPNFLYARTTNNKTIDVSYAPQSLDAVEYIKNDAIEQPKMDLEKEIDSFFPESYFETAINFEDAVDIAHHFYELGLKARKEK